MLPQKLLVPFDFSASSETALDWASHEQKQCGSTALVLHIINPIPLGAVTMPVVAPPPSEEEIELIQRDLREVMKRHDLQGDVEILFAPSPGEAVVRTAASKASTLIVMGTHGRGGITRAVLGSVADYVVRHAHCPVLTLRACAHAAA